MTVGRIFLITSLTVILVAGCVPTLPVVSGPPLPQEAVEKIEPGKTKKAQIFEWFGPPMAIGAKGDRLTIPTAWVGGELRPGGYYQTEADSFFELFSSKHTISDHHRVYYYYRAVSNKRPFFALLVIYETSSVGIDKLWILVNEETGTVEDYVFLRRQ